MCLLWQEEEKIYYVSHQTLVKLSILQAMRTGNPVSKRTAGNKKSNKTVTDGSYYSNCNPGLYHPSEWYSQDIIFWTLNCTYLTPLNLAPNNQLSVRNEKNEANNKLPNWIRGTMKCEQVWLCVKQHVAKMPVLANEMTVACYANCPSKIIFACYLCPWAHIQSTWELQHVIQNDIHQYRQLCETYMHRNPPIPATIRINRALHQSKFGMCKLS